METDLRDANAFCFNHLRRKGDEEMWKRMREVSRNSEEIFEKKKHVSILK